MLHDFSDLSQDFVENNPQKVIIATQNSVTFVTFEALS